MINSWNAVIASWNQHREPRAQPGQHGALLPAGAQHLVEAVRAPDAEQADQAAAADVDEVLAEQVRADVAHAALAADP